MPSSEISETASRLYLTGLNMISETMKSDRLPKSHRLFLISWGERLQHSAQWILDQEEAGVLGTPDILAMVQLEVDVAESHAARELSPV